MSITVDDEKGLLYAPDGAHSAWGPSSAKKWIHCPGSINAAKGRPNRSSIYANEGTAAHAVSEACRVHDVKAVAFKGWTVRVSRGKEGDANFETSDHVCDQVMIDSVQEFVDYCNDIPAELVLIEQLLPYARYVEPGFGTLDDGRLSDNLCVITDFKHGQGVQVWAKKNEQLMLQAVSVFLKYKHWFEFSKVVLRIAQPRLGHFDEWETTIEEILTWAEAVAKPGYLATLNPNAPRAAGDWCQFCTAKHDCETRAREVLGNLVGEFEDISEATTTIKEAEINPAAMSSADVARCLSVLDRVLAWAKDLKTHGQREVAAGRPPCEPGQKPWKLVEGRSKRIYIVPEDELIEELHEQAGLEDSQIFTKKLITPAKLEKIIGKKHEIMKTCVKKPPGRPKLAPGDDRRPPMEQALIAQFDDIDEEKDDEDD